MATTLLDAATGRGSSAGRVADELLAVLSASDAEIRHFPLGLTDIGACHGHFDCWVRSPGRCRIADEAQEIERAVVRSDRVVMLSPVRFGALGSDLKKAVDRLIPLVLPFFRLHAGLTHHRLRYDHMPSFVTIGLSEGPEESDRTALFSAMCESIALNIGAKAWNATILHPGEDARTRFAEALCDLRTPGNPTGSFAATQAMLRDTLQASGAAIEMPAKPRVAILTGSAKTGGKSNSGAIGRYLEERYSAAGAGVSRHTVTGLLRGRALSDDRLRQLAEADLLAIAAPLYVDGLPYLVTRMLEALADMRGRDARPACLLGVVNCGFPEAEHTRFAFGVLRRFADAAGYRFAGGIALPEAEAIDGRPLETLGGMTAALRRALDEAAEATLAGRGLPVETTQHTLLPMMPPRAFRTMASALWYWRAWTEDGPVLGLHDTPLRSIPEAEWEALALSGWARARPLRLIGRRQETPTAVTLLFEDPAHDPIRYEAGQYITLEAEIGGQTVRRAYSLSSIPRDTHLSVTVKRVPGGLMSNHLHDGLGIGAMLRSYGPAGTFTAAGAEDGAPRHLCLVAGGAGIVPLQAIARSVLHDDTQSRVTLIYGSASPVTTLFAEELAALAQAFPQRLGLHMVYETTARGPGSRLDDAGLDPILSGMDLASFDGVYLCGPDGMRRAARAAFVSRGVPEGLIEEEAFSTPVAAHRPEAPQQAVLCHADGTRQTITVPAGATLLDACLDAGAPLRFSCMSGICGLCRVRILEGAGNASKDAPLPDAGAPDLAPACILRLLGPIRFEIV